MSNINILYYNGKSIMVINESNVHINGSIEIYNNYDYNVSDTRLKTIISNIEDPLDKIMQIDTFKYKYNDLAHTLNIYDENIHIGFNAQNIEQLYPEMISKYTIQDIEVLHISYEQFIPILIECIKSLKKKISILNVFTTKRNFCLFQVLLREFKAIVFDQSFVIISNHL
jgi:hypothetical protein